MCTGALIMLVTFATVLGVVVAVAGAACIIASRGRAAKARRPDGIGGGTTG
jgi:hypothetical protein